MKKKVWVYEEINTHKEDRRFAPLTGKEMRDWGEIYLGTTEIEITPEVKTVRREIKPNVFLSDIDKSAYVDITQIPRAARNVKISFDEPVEGKDEV